MIVILSTRFSNDQKEHIWKQTVKRLMFETKILVFFLLGTQRKKPDKIDVMGICTARVPETLNVLGYY